MCGITGIYAFNQIGSFYMINLAKSIDSLSFRGPDGRGSYIEDFIGLGHRRLSIFDPSPLGKQPMKDETGRYVIVFNGEIFNYQILRNQLQDKGHSFVSGSDTEVLLKLFIEKGKECLNDLKGFFAFAIYDTKERSLFLARDRFGVKPLLYYRDEDKFIFSSELKALVSYNIPRDLNYTALYSYLQLNYVPAPLTMFNGIFKLEPGHYMLVKEKEFKVEKYYDIPYNPYPSTALTFEEQKSRLIDLMEESVKLRLLSDVPLGAFLSGGIDSSAIVALASRHSEKLNTFSIGYKDEPFFDETKYAQLVAKKYSTEHTVFSLTNQDLYEDLFNMLNYLDEPFADSSSLPVYILSKRTAQKVKVALSGDGGDELFAGYNKHLAELRIRNGGFLPELITALGGLWKILPKSRNGILTNKFRQFHRFAEGMKMTPAERYWRYCSISSQHEANSLLSQDSLQKLQRASFEKEKKKFLKYFDKKGDINQVLISDMHLVLPNDMLVKVDMMSMANGLELREPFLDHSVVEFAFSLPQDSKIQPSIKKRVVQEAFRSILPEELYRRPKKGFEVPLLKWMRKDLNDLMKNDLLSREFVAEQGIFSFPELEKLQKQLHSGDPADSASRLWGIIVFQYWWKQYFINK